MRNILTYVIYTEKTRDSQARLAMTKQVDFSLHTSSDVKDGSQACYVLITCTHPKKDGTMQVEMTYEGEAALAAYLIESAQNLIKLED